MCPMHSIWCHRFRKGEKHTKRNDKESLCVQIRPVENLIIGLMRSFYFSLLNPLWLWAATYLFFFAFHTYCPPLAVLFSLSSTLHPFFWRLKFCPTDFKLIGCTIYCQARNRQSKNDFLFFFKGWIKCSFYITYVNIKVNMEISFAAAHSKIKT